MIFACPRCDHRTVQDDIVRGCSHYCPAEGGKLVALVKVKS